MINKNMKKYILLILLFLFFFQVAYALENIYPEIKIPGGTYTINENSSLGDYVAYALVMIIIMATVILLMVLMWAGVNFIMSGGDPGRISKAKEMAINGFVGMIILLSFYLILNSINPGIIDVVEPNLGECSEGGILLALKDGTNTIKTCISQSNGKIEKEIIEAKWFFDRGQVKEVWAFDDYDFKGNATSIFQDGVGGSSACMPREDYSKEGDVSGLVGKKSIYIIPRLHGFYFYDKTNYGINSYTPFFVSQSVSNIADKYPGFDNKASSFSTIQATSEITGLTYTCNIHPKAIIFEEANYSGKCSLLYSSKSSSLQAPSELPDQGNNTYIGNNKMSSIIVYNIDKDKEYDSDKGRIILYNALACPESDVSGGLLSKCEIKISAHHSIVLEMNDIKTICPDWDLNSYIQSIRIPDGKGAVIIMTGNGNCAYFDKSKVNSANCIIDLREHGISSEGTDLGIKPNKIIVIPTN